MSAQTITGVNPSAATTTNVTAADDWATKVLQDPMDMKQNTDLSWSIWSNDQPIPTLTGIAFNQTNLNGSGLFHAQSTGTNNFLEILQSSNSASANLGRTGAQFPIDASTYQILAFRMCLTDNGTDPNQNHVRRRDESGGLDKSFNNSVALLSRSPGDVYAGSITQDGTFSTYADCQVYTVDLTLLPHALTGAPWSGTLRWLRFDPTYIGGVTIDIDWIRLVAPQAPQTITWSGGAADIYLDDNNIASDGNLGMLYKNGALARGVSSPYTFPMSALEGGSYYVRICPQNAAYTSNSCAYTGVYNVNGIPTIQVTAPSQEGSSDDFATVQLNNAWDFDALSDIDYYQNLNSPTIDSAFPAQRPDGTDLGNIRVFKGTSIASPNAGWGDPYFYTLWYAGSGRGVTKKIDADRYRVLTVDMGLPGARDINGGSIARVVWKTTTETAENVSQDIIVNHRAGVNILDTINVDMKTLLTETDATAGTPPGFHGTAGWNGQIENFRFDPHEFSPATNFWVKRIKLAAFETIGSTGTYTIKWNASDAFDSGSASAARVTAYYQAANTAGTAPTGAQTKITTCDAVLASAGQCTWNMSTPGTYYVYLSISDGVNTNAAYSKYPVIVDPAFQPKPRIVLDRSLVNFGGTANGTVVTPPQQVKLTVVGTGTVNWTATTSGSASSLFCVSPTSGTGSAVLTVSICSTAIDNRVVGNLGTVVVTSSQADNSPQAVTVYLKMTATSGNPFGGFDTPADNAVLQGSVAVTGWALDDIGISKVDILRDAHPNDPPGAVFNGKVFIATATLVEGARGDIVSLFPNAPVNYNAGWGYLMLTRGLIWDGKGPFKLYAEATDIEGHKVTLGSKTVTVDNASAIKPFGAIDTPAQGQSVTGSMTNFGWALTPGTCKIQSNGVQVSIDSGPLQAVTYGDARPDIAAGFPGFTNSGNAGGHFALDTTALTDGVHTIGWLVTDDCARADGVGSRFFKSSNGVFSSLIANQAHARPALAGSGTAFARLGEPAEKIGAPRTTMPVSFGLGMKPGAVRHAATEAGRSEIRIRQTERVVVSIGAPAKDTAYAAYRVLNGELRFLPVGSSFDTAKGLFYWQPAPGFAGDYDFVFVKSVRGREVAQTPVRVTVGPSSAALRAGLFRATDTPAVATPETR